MAQPGPALERTGPAGGRVGATADAWGLKLRTLPCAPMAEREAAGEGVAEEVMATSHLEGVALHQLWRRRTRLLASLGVFASKGTEPVFWRLGGVATVPQQWGVTFGQVGLYITLSALPSDRDGSRIDPLEVLRHSLCMLILILSTLCVYQGTAVCFNWNCQLTPIKLSGLRLPRTRYTCHFNTAASTCEKSNLA